MGNQLFRRKFSLQVGDAKPVGPGLLLLDVSELACRFKVKKTIKPEPNTCAVTIKNLSPEHRKHLEGPKKLAVKLAAGYVDNISQIYFGEVRSAHSITDGSDIFTTLESGDGAKEIQAARISTNFGKGTPAREVLKALAKALGVGTGNLDKAIELMSINGVADYFSSGGVMYGNAARELTRFTKSVGLEWSIQSGQLLFLANGKPTDGAAFELSSDSGLLGSPTLDNKGILRAQCLMIPEIRPGTKLAMKAQHVQGGFRVTDIEYTGDTHGDEWTCDISAKRY